MLAGCGTVNVKINAEQYHINAVTHGTNRNQYKQWMAQHAFAYKVEGFVGIHGFAGIVIHGTAQQRISHNTENGCHARNGRPMPVCL